MNRFLVAIDGPAGSGKSSVAREVARRLGIVDINTGAAYRAVALAALRKGVDPDDGAEVAGLAKSVELYGGGVKFEGVPVPDEELRTPEVSDAASKLSANPQLRSVLLPVQRRAAEEARRGGGAVVEGRDIGTVVLPEAELKIYLSASPEERARRRAAQSGREGELERVKRAMSIRDRQDSEREAAPLKPASDAVILDTTSMSFEEVVERILDLARNLRKEA